MRSHWRDEMLYVIIFLVVFAISLAVLLKTRGVKP